MRMQTERRGAATASLKVARESVSEGASWERAAQSMQSRASWHNHGFSSYRYPALFFEFCQISAALNETARRALSWYRSRRDFQFASRRREVNAIERSSRVIAEARWLIQ